MGWDRAGVSGYPHFSFRVGTRSTFWPRRPLVTAVASLGCTLPMLRYPRVPSADRSACCRYRRAAGKVLEPGVLGGHLTVVPSHSNVGHGQRKLAKAVGSLGSETIQVPGVAEGMVG